MNGQLSPKSPEMVDEENDTDSLLLDHKIYDETPEIYNPDYSIDPQRHTTKLSPVINPLEEEESEKEMELERPRIEMINLQVRDSFKETYSHQIQELLEKPVIERFEIFLQEFREKKIRSKISINLQHEDFENFCTVAHVVFEPDFAQIPTVGSNLMKCFLNTMCAAARNNMGAYSIYEKIMQTLAEIEPLATTHYLYYIVSSMEKLPHILEEGYFKLFNEKHGTSYVNKDFQNLYSKLDQDVFLELLSIAIRKFSYQIRANPALIQPFIEFNTPAFTMQMKLGMSDGSLILFDENCYKALKDSLEWPSYHQMYLWDLLQSQFMSYVKINHHELFSKMVQELNAVERSQQEEPITTELLMGFRALSIAILSAQRDELEVVEIISIILELGPSYGTIVYSILNQFPINLVKLSIRSFLKNNSERSDKIKCLANHILIWKQKEFSFRGEKVVFEDQLKTLILKAVKKTGAGMDLELF